MKKIMPVLIGMFLLSAFIVFAHGEEDFAKAEDIIKQKVPCKELSEGQLELLGDYYMEQMHPGEAHEIMDEMMGGEGSESLRQMHVNMAKSFYCGEHNAMSGNMMNVMMGGDMVGMTGGGMMNKGGMMNMMSGGMMNGGMSNMMNNWMGGNFWTWSFVWLVYLAIAGFVVGLAFWFAYKLIIGNKRRKG